MDSGWFGSGLEEQNMARIITRDEIREQKLKSTGVHDEMGVEGWFRVVGMV